MKSEILSFKRKRRRVENTKSPVRSYFVLMMMIWVCNIQKVQALDCEPLAQPGLIGKGWVHHEDSSGVTGHCKAGNDATKANVDECNTHCQDDFSDCEWFEWWPDTSTCKVRKNIGDCTIEESNDNVLSYRPSDFIDNDCDCLPDYCPDGMTCESTRKNSYMVFQGQERCTGGCDLQAGAFYKYSVNGYTPKREDCLELCDSKFWCWTVANGDLGHPFCYLKNYQSTSEFGAGL